MLEIDTQDWRYAPDAYSDAYSDGDVSDLTLLCLSDTDLHFAAMHFAREEEAAS